MSAKDPLTSMNVSLTQDMRAFVDGLIAKKTYVSASEYVRALINADRAQREAAAKPIRVRRVPH